MSMISSDATPLHSPTAAVVAPLADPVEQGLLEIVRAHTRSEGTGWTLATTLTDAQIDSFDFVELIFEIEDRFGIEVNVNANTTSPQDMTFGDVVDLIRTGIAAKPSVS